MRLLCPWCQKAIQINDELEGALVQCPECDCRLTAPTLGIHVKPSAPSVPDYHPTEADWEKQPTPFTMRQLLDTLKQATDAERQEFAKCIFDMPFAPRVYTQPVLTIADL